MNVLYRDEQLFVVSKASGELAQPDRTGDADVLTMGKDVLRTEPTEDPFLGLVHRLDRPTSGVMVLARTSAAARILSKQFREHTAEKQYLAIVEGKQRGIGTWQDYVAKPGRTPTLVPPDDPDGKYAELEWQALRREDEKSVLHIQLRTGRPHQIRLQAAERGTPVVGDTRYGASESLPDGAIALHHGVLRIDHPESGIRRTFVAPLPDVWSSLLSGEVLQVVEDVLGRASSGSQSIG